MSDQVKWTLAQGAAECNRLESFLIPHGFHCALGGSVLHRSRSFTDLDVFVYPHKTEGAKSVEEVVRLLEGFYSVPLHQAVHNGKSRSVADESKDGKIVYYCREDGQRIDFFFVS